MKYLAILSFVALAACGADGEPVQPTASINVGSGGVSAGVGVSKGPIAISIGL